MCPSLTGKNEFDNENGERKFLSFNLTKIKASVCDGEE